jgi:hypothetical protein
MDIPVIPVRTVGNNMVASHITFSGTDVIMDDNIVGYRDLLNSLSGVCDKETPIIAVDIVGLQRMDIEPEILRRIRSKREMWLMTGIRDAGDVMDAFHGNISKLVVPYHMTSDDLLREMNELSDSCIPALFADRDGVHMKGRRRELRTVIRALEKIGFRRMIVFDTSSSDPTDTWNSLYDLADAIIPYASSKEDADVMREIGFRDVMLSGIRLFRNAAERSEIRSCMLP